MKNKKISSRAHTHFILFWLVSIACAVWILQWNVFQSINNLFFDPLTTGADRQDVVIVGIDEKSLAQYGAFPWDRNVYARIVEMLDEYNPRAIGFDIVFAEPRAGDDALYRALIQADTPTVFASKIEQGQYIPSLFVNTSLNVQDGVANVFPDPDAKVRSVQNYFLIGGTCTPSFSRAVFSGAMRLPEVASAVCDTSPYLFRYQKNIEKVSVVDVVDGVVPQETIKDKIVLIGFATTDLEQDSFFGLFGSKINGVEIHASAIAHALNRGSLEVVPLYTTLGITLVLALAVAFLPFLIQRFFIQIVVLGSVGVATFLGAIVGYEFGYKTYIPWIVGIPLVSYGMSLVYVHVLNVRKNDYLRKLFGTYVHPSLLEELIQDPKKLKLGGEKRRMTVLFSDVRGFTSFSEKLSPEELVDLLNDYLNTMSPLILERKGTIDKYIGDAIMAFWNAPVFIPNHELVAVETALHMQEALVRFNQKLNRKDGLTLGIGIGVNTGDMVVGNMGSDQRFNYTVMGDAVNTGSRFEGLTKKYGVVTIVGESTRNAITDESILFRKLDIMTVKGKSDPTTIYEPVRASETMKQFVHNYEQGFDAYVKGDFATAKQYLAPLAEHSDEPSKMLLERMKTIDVSTWKGVWKWDEK